MATTSNSFASNDDGDGLYISHSDKIVKSMTKINLFDFNHDIEKSDIVITHQRLSTSGHTIEFCHPFYDDNFVLVHNGIINQFQGKVGSDTSGFFLAFTDLFNKKIKNRKDREKCIIETLKELFKKDGGFYSIFILDKKTKRSYYFKNSTTHIIFYRIGNLIYITTSYDNCKFISMLTQDKYNEIEIKDNEIYRIEDSSTKLQVISLGELTYIAKPKELKEIKSKSLWSYNSAGKTSKNEYVEKCSNCGGETNGTTYYNYDKVYCDDCWSFIKNY